MVNKCPRCGGDLQSNGNGELQCAFCGWCGYIDNQASSQFSSKKDVGASIIFFTVRSIIYIILGFIFGVCISADTSGIDGLIALIVACIIIFPVEKVTIKKIWSAVYNDEKKKLRLRLFFTFLISFAVGFVIGLF